jgi:hypothetical protein
LLYTPIPLLSLLETSAPDSSDSVVISKERFPCFKTYVNNEMHYCSPKDDNVLKEELISIIVKHQLAGIVPQYSDT